MNNQENSVFHKNAVFFIEVDKIKPNPFQPRRDFDPAKLNELADSIRMYGILQPLVVTRKEVVKEDGGLATEYELIAGERRLRASKIANLREVPALIRSAEDDDRTKLELAIIENLQREDLNSIDRALAFKQLSSQFNFSHAEIGKKMGRSREYVSNTLRLLMLPDDMQQALKERKISEGHTRPLLMLIDRPEEQGVLFKEIMLRKMTVRDAEKVARRIAYDKVRKKDQMYNPELVEIEEEVSGALGTRVHIEQKEKGGGRIEIDFFDEEGLKNILEVIRENKKRDDPFAKFPQSNIVGESKPVDSTGDLKEDNNFNYHEDSEGQDSGQGQSKEQGSFENENDNDNENKRESVSSSNQSSPAPTPQNTPLETEGDIDPVEKVEEQIANEAEIQNEIEPEVQADFPEEESVSDDSDEDELYSVGDFNI
jgi:ParB family chromosome partitioning protein